MDLKKIVLTFVALGALGWVAWENRVPIAEALGIEIESPEQLRSIDLAKKGYDLDRYRQNHVVVRDALIGNGTLLATTRLVYAPDGAAVEIIPNIVTNLTTLVSSNLTTVVSSNLSTAKPAVAAKITDKKKPGS